MNCLASPHRIDCLRVCAVFLPRACRVPAGLIFHSFLQTWSPDNPEEGPAPPLQFIAKHRKVRARTPLTTTSPVVSGTRTMATLQSLACCWF